MTLEEAKKLMESRGYSLHYRTGDGSLIGMAKNVSDDLCVHATVWLDKVQLSTITGLFTMQTGEFSIGHPHFVDWFESPLIRMTHQARLVHRV